MPNRSAFFATPLVLLFVATPVLAWQDLDDEVARKLKIATQEFAQKKG